MTKNIFKDIPTILNNNFKQLFGDSFSSAKTATISLDIGSAYIKAISAEKNNQGVKITGFACEKIGLDIKNDINKAISSLPTNKKDLSLSVSGEGIVSRYVNLPIMSHEETEKSMVFELEKYIPLSREEVNFDFAILKNNKNTGKMLVLIAAAKKDLIAEKNKLCQDVGYSISFIDVGSLAIANYCEFVGRFKEGVCAVINLGASLSSLDIIEDGLLVLSRDIFIGGNDFTRKISESLDKDLKEAEQIKLASTASDLSSAFESVFNNLISELKVSFDFYETQANRLVDKVFITGGSSRLRGIVEVFKQSLGQEVELISYNSDRFKLAPSLDSKDFRDKFNFLTVALGTALR